MHYPKQRARMLRWYERLRTISRIGRVGYSTEESRDDAYAFFLNCFQLRDWIQNDAKVPGKTQKAAFRRAFCDDNLALCADIANAVKHLRLNRSASGKNPKDGPTHSTIVLDNTQSSGRVITRFTIKTDDGKVLDAFDLATACVTAWDEFFKLHNL